MDSKAQEYINQVQSFYAGDELKKKLSRGTKPLKTFQNLEEIGRDELFCLNFEPRSISRPSKNLTILIIGNHSAGKSSFINWYIEDKVQRTGIAIETSNFTMVKHGERNIEVKSEGTLAMYPFLRELMRTNKKEVYGKFFEKLTTKISSSKAKNFEKIDFIDTPGLTDGDALYDCDIIEMIKWVAGHVDGVLVFLDPIGQALCSKTLKIVEFLHEKYREKTVLCLTKVDQIDQEDFSKLNMQIYSAIISKTKDIHSEIVPISVMKEESSGNNRVKYLLEKIDKMFNEKVIRNIDFLIEDCRFIVKRSKEMIDLNDQTQQIQKALAKFRKFVLALIGILLALLVFFWLELENVLENRSVCFVGVLEAILIFLVFWLSRQTKKSFDAGQISKIKNWISYCNSAIEEGERLTQDYINNE